MKYIMHTNPSSYYSNMNSGLVLCLLLACLVLACQGGIRKGDIFDM